MKWGDLYRDRELTRKTLQAFRDDGLPAAIPLMNTDIFSSLWLADNVGSFFAEGGALYIHSPIEPSGIEHGCQGWAIWGNALWDRDAKITGYTAF